MNVQIVYVMMMSIALSRLIHRCIVDRSPKLLPMLTDRMSQNQHLVLVNFCINTHPFNGPFSRTTQVSRYQNGKTNLDFTEARDSEWQWHQQEHMQVCTSLQTDNHTNTPPLSFYRPDALPAAQPTVTHEHHNFNLTMNDCDSCLC